MLTKMYFRFLPPLWIKGHEAHEYFCTVEQGGAGEGRYVAMHLPPTHSGPAAGHSGCVARFQRQHPLRVALDLFGRPEAVPQYPAAFPALSICWVVNTNEP